MNVTGNQNAEHESQPQAATRVAFDHKARYRAPEPVSTVFDAIEVVFRTVEDARSRHVAVFDADGMNGAHAHKYIREVLGFIYGIYLEKFSELIRALVQASNSGNYLAVALAGRALLESVAMLKYYNNELADIGRKAESSEQFSEADLRVIVDVLDQHSRGGRFDWNEFWATDSKTYAAMLVERGKKRFPNQSNPAQVRIGKAIEQWTEQEPLAGLAYDLFCELVHPNLGSTFLVMGFAKNGIAVGGDIPHGLGRDICHQALRLLYVAIHEIPKELARAIWFWGTTRPDLQG